MEQHFSKKIQSEQIVFKYAKGSSSKTGKEFHTYHEIIYYMGGKAKFVSDSVHMDLKPNTLVIVPAETYHQLLITGSQDDYHRCVFHFSNLPELEELIERGMTGAMILNMNKQFQYLFRKMIALTEKEYSEAVNVALMKSVLTLLLNEIALNVDLEEESAAPDTMSEKCVAYISEHISENLVVSDIAKELNVSISYLAHTFKKQMNISIYQYILKKRLIMAHHKITAGVPATQAAVECGFNDYSGFYKQFKKMFGKAPSRKKDVVI